MPIYEYECQGCKKHFEYMQSMSEPPKSSCEACGGRLEKQISPSGFILKGGGWYKDLYSSSKPGGGGGASESSEPTKVDKPKGGSSSGGSSPASGGGGSD